MPIIFSVSGDDQVRLKKITEDTIKPRLKELKVSPQLTSAGEKREK